MSEKLIETLLSKNIVQYGDFTLKSGQKSNIYVNLKNLPSYPLILEQISCEIIEKLQEENYDFEYVCGVPYGGIPLATKIGLDLVKPILILRKEEKEYGSKKLLEGVYEKGKTVLLLEDVVTTGSSLENAKKILEEHGLYVICFSILNRGNSNYPSLLTLKDIDRSSSYKIRGFIERKSKICVAADVTSSSELYRLIHNVGKHICILKTHIDILEDWSEDVRNNLIRLKKEYGFLIWEDRKFADIAHIVFKQVHDGIYKISSWADIVTVHLVSGPDILDVCSPCMVFGVIDMSSKDSLLNREKSLDYCRKGGVAGVVTQMPNVSNRILKVVPGIKLESGKDDKGQQYNTIENRKWADIFVVGRGITQSIDPEKAVIEYVERSKRN